MSAEPQPKALLQQTFTAKQSEWKKNARTIQHIIIKNNLSFTIGIVTISYLYIIVGVTVRLTIKRFENSSSKCFKFKLQ